MKWAKAVSTALAWTMSIVVSSKRLIYPREHDQSSSPVSCVIRPRSRRYIVQSSKAARTLTTTSISYIVAMQSLPEAAMRRICDTPRFQEGYICIVFTALDRRGYTSSYTFHPTYIAPYASFLASALAQHHFAANDNEVSQQTDHVLL